MRTGVNLLDFGDVLQVAVKIGYDWNAAHDFLAKDILPWLGEHTIDHHLSDVECNAYGWSEETLKVMKAVFEENKVDYFVLEG